MTERHIGIAAALGPVVLSASVAGQPPPFVVAGHLLDETGQPVADARVCASPVPASGSSRCGVTSTDGAFEIRLREPGPHELVPNMSEHGYYPQVLEYFRDPQAARTEVTVSEERPRVETVLPLGRRNGMLVGTVIDADSGSPVDNAQFTVCLAARRHACWNTVARSPDGEFRVPAAHEPFTLLVRAPHYVPWTGPDGPEGRTPIAVAPGMTSEMTVLLRRVPSARGDALHEHEKQVGVHLPAPIQVNPPADAEMDFFPRRTLLEWQLVDGAVAYSVEVDFCTGRRRERGACENPQPYRSLRNTTGIRDTRYEFNFVGAQPGRWRVWAVDEHGREGFKSPWRTFVHRR